MKLDLRGAPVAALLTPRTASGAVDVAALERNLDFVLERGVAGVAIGGATGEYPLCSFEERRLMLERACRVIARRAVCIAGIGAGDFADCVALGTHAAQSGAAAALLPPPHFFPYAQPDVEAFYLEAARQIPLPLLIYNLPAFTTGVDTATALRLLDSTPAISGVKDSSGSLEMLRAMGGRALRLAGNDAVLGPALDEGVCDSAISGIAGVLPELTISIFRAAERRAALARLRELLPKLDAFPTPWGLKLIARSRGLFEPHFPLPLAASRRAAMEEFCRWFERWWPASV